MRRFYSEEISGEEISGADSRVELTGGEFAHLKKVLRLIVGDEVAVFDGKGHEVVGTIETIGKSSATVRVTAATLNKGEDEKKIILLQGLLKSDKPELVIQKATELGVNEIIFYSSERTVALVAREKGAARIARWRKTAIEAAKQCGRTVIPKISILSLDEALTAGQGLLRIIIWENEQRSTLKSAIKGSSNATGVAVVIGPEGGLTKEEVTKAKAAGYASASLGKLILRAETAAIAAIAMLRFFFSEA